MSGDSAPGLRARMGAALSTAMRARDRVAVAALRSALGRVSNAEAVPVDSVPRAGALHDAPVGAGAADAPRRELTEADVRTVVEAEVAEHERAAGHFTAGRPPGRRGPGEGRGGRAEDAPRGALR